MKEYKDYEEMNLVELQEAYLDELDNLVNQIPKIEKVRWLANIRTADSVKIRTMRGYIMGIQDCGKNIGDLKLLLEYISKKVE